MTAKLDGTNGLLQQYDYQVPTTGFSYTFAAGVNVLVMNPAGTLATGTITMPASPADGMTITFSSTQTITALTLNGNTGQTVVGGPTSLGANSAAYFVYRLANTTWYPLSGSSAIVNATLTSPTINGTPVMGASILTRGTAQTAPFTAPNTYADFTGIPSWVKRITVNVNSIVQTGTVGLIVQIGSGSVETTGYQSVVATIASGGTFTYSSSTAGFIFSLPYSNTLSISGSVILTNMSGNIWTCLSAGSMSSAPMSSGGSKTTTGTIDRLRITTTSGTPTFSSGSINILYE